MKNKNCRTQIMCGMTLICFEIFYHPKTDMLEIEKRQDSYTLKS